MKSFNEKFKIELTLRNKKQEYKIQPMHQTEAVRFSKSQYQNLKKQSQPRQSPALQKKGVITIANQPLQINPEKLTTIGSQRKKNQEYQQFTEKCLNFLLKKKLNIQEQRYPQEFKETKTNQFENMMNELKLSLKEKQKKKRQVQSEIRYYGKADRKTEFQMIKSTNQTQKPVDLFKVLKSSEIQPTKSVKFLSKDKLKRPDSLGVTSNRYFVKNPFEQMNVVICYGMSISEAPTIKKPNFDSIQPKVQTSHSQRKVEIKIPSKDKVMNFRIKQDYDNQYMKKIKSFLQFLFKVNFSNNIYVNLQLKIKEQAGQKYKIYVGSGNNSLLIKSLMKRRFWWQILDKYDESKVNFAWSQNKIQQLHDKQTTKQNKKIIQKQPSKKQKQTDQMSNNNNRKILMGDKSKEVQKYINKNGFSIPFEEIYKPQVITNHIPHNNTIGSKKNLFKSMYNYFKNIKNDDPFDYIPKTYHIKSLDSPQYKQFILQNQSDPKRVWIVKPGQNTNRGNGIELSTFSNLKTLLKPKKHQDNTQMTHILQSYISKPFLYNSRKFDIRHYLMITSINGIIKAYWYKQGYIRTSSEIYDLEDLENQFVHLTNDAIQKQSQYYAKYEAGNKISYSQFQRYLDFNHGKMGYVFQRDILGKMKEICADIVRANYRVMDPLRKQTNFQIYGLDFMIDKQFKPWLIEVNYNPCLEISCPLLNRIIPAMIQNSLRLGLDPLFPPKQHYPINKRYFLSDNYLKNLRYELIFDQSCLSAPIENLYSYQDNDNEEEQYHDDGKEVDQLIQ